MAHSKQTFRQTKRGYCCLALMMAALGRRPDLGRRPFHRHAQTLACAAFTIADELATAVPRSAARAKGVPVMSTRGGRSCCTHAMLAMCHVECWPGREFEWWAHAQEVRKVQFLFWRIDGLLGWLRPRRRHVRGKLLLQRWAPKSHESRQSQLPNRHPCAYLRAAHT